MRRTALALALGAMAVPAAAKDFPARLQGLWAESPITCDLARKGNPPSDRSWLRIDGDVVMGTTIARLSRVRGPTSAEAIDRENPNIAIDLSLRGPALAETVVGARASMLYVHCRG